ncbi:MAG: carboxypeptidase-like regulatory domain-containing protein, partial [bacterium]|nr:carboxypeptidase-like regulatory domain-containing protein [bacterium]
DPVRFDQRKNIRCVLYPTAHQRVCGAPKTANQCKWNTWGPCETAATCGNGATDTGEECDLGDKNGNSACTLDCKKNLCGDGALNIGAEECDLGVRNGAACANAEYGTTCAGCSKTCHFTVSSGGYCGDGHKDTNTAEQCDDEDGLKEGGKAITCASLGYDYSSRVTVTCDQYRLACVDPVSGTVTSWYSQVDADAAGTAEAGDHNIDKIGVNAKLCFLNRDGMDPATPYLNCLQTNCNGNIVAGKKNVVVDASNVSLCESSTVKYKVTNGEVACTKQCAFTGCARCQEGTGFGVIRGTVHDAVYTNIPVAGARVVLYSKGIRVKEALTDEYGKFNLEKINERPECAYYRLVVDFYGDNAATKKEREDTNGGYWPYETVSFSLLDTQALKDLNEIYLVPKVPVDETLVVFTFRGSMMPEMASRPVEAQLVLPPQMSYTYVTNKYAYENGTAFTQKQWNGNGADSIEPKFNFPAEKKKPNFAFFNGTKDQSGTITAYTTSVNVGWVWSAPKAGDYYQLAMQGPEAVCSDWEKGADNMPALTRVNNDICDTSTPDSLKNCKNSCMTYRVRCEDIYRTVTRDGIIRYLGPFSKPNGRGVEKTDAFTDGAIGADSWAGRCARTIVFRDHSLVAVRNLSMFPHSRIDAYDGGGNSVWYDETKIHVVSTRYRRGPWATAGRYSYFLMDVPMQDALPWWDGIKPHEGKPGYAEWLQEIGATVHVSTHDEYYAIRAPKTTEKGEACVNPMFWLPFQQDAYTGRIILTQNPLMCYKNAPPDKSFCTAGVNKGKQCQKVEDCPVQCSPASRCSAGLNAGNSCQVDSDCPVNSDEECSVDGCTKPVCEHESGCPDVACQKQKDVPTRTVPGELVFPQDVVHGYWGNSAAYKQ